MEPLNPASAIASFEALLRRIVKDLGPEYCGRLAMSFNSIVQPSKTSDSNMETEEVDIDEESSTTSTLEESSTEEDPSEITSSEEDSSDFPLPGQKRPSKALKDKSTKRIQLEKDCSKNPIKVLTPVQTETEKSVKKTLTPASSSSTASTSAATKSVPASPSSKSAATKPIPAQPTKMSNKSTMNPAKAPGMPPIFCYSGNIAEISRFCKSKGLSVTFKNRNTKTTIISTGNREAFESIKNFLKARKIQFNSFTPHEDRKNLLLLKGIHHTYAAIEVEDELRIEGLPVIKVSHFIAKRAQGKTYNNFVVELSKTCDINEVYTKTLIMNQRVHWERLKSDDIVQCRNCQRFGHVATNCGRQYVCVKCKEDHEPGQCQRKENTGLDVWCANCKKEGHPASFKGCPTLKVRLTEKNKMSAQKKAQQVFAAKSACLVTRPALSFAAMVKGGSSQKPTFSRSQQQQQKTTPAKVITPQATTPRSGPTKPTSTASTNLNTEVQRIFGSDLLTVIGKARSAVPSNYAQLSEGEKSVALATFIFQICN